ncbi:MAG: membrane protein insertase YidC [Phycisphaeraceae bacterium]|nr:membrane protein insertase YidC [Phycisphaerae bacterium]MBX3393137.1 membrane protein insertase YidC [Phycisphaeraceae bacterium]
MQQQPSSQNVGLRIVVLLVMILAGLGVVWSVGKNSSRQQQPQPPAPAVELPSPEPRAGDAAPVTGPDQASDASRATRPSMSGVEPPEPEAPMPKAGAPLRGLRASVFPGDPLATSYARAGSVDPLWAAGVIEFSPIGAGIREYRLSEHFVDWRRSTNYTIQSEKVVPLSRQPDGSVAPATVTPMAALGVEVDGSFVVLAASAGGPTWRQVAAERPGVFEAFVEDESGRRVLRVEREYVIGREHEVGVRQTIFNLSPASMTVRWLQLGPVDLPQDSDGYGGDRRRVPMGYLLPPSVDPARQTVMADEFAGRLRSELFGRASVVGYPAEWDVWPDSIIAEKRLELCWSGMTNRYFGVAGHPVVDVTSSQPVKTWGWVEVVKRVLVNPVDATGESLDPIMAYRFDSRPLVIPAGASADVSMGLWMGPLSKPLMKSEPVADAMGIRGMVVYNMGGPCAWCTFEPVTFVLRHVLHFLHDRVFRDWSMAIIFLVVFVRTCLHPLTRWSQIRMQRFGKQMSLMQPKQKKIQERYRDDPKKMQAEMAALWREEGVSPFGMLGCLPMLLVTPVWLSLYALLFYAVELRNEPAFYGAVQWITGGNWGFLADMSHPDALVSFGRSFHVPLLSSLMGPIGSLNVLPLLLGVVFFFHQKYLTPPSATPLTPEQVMQQRMIKFMSVFMFPVFMYNSPAGLALYFTTNSALAIVENAWIRRHINKHGLLDEDKLRRAPRDPNAKGLLARLTEAAEQKRQAAEAKARRDQLNKGRGRK